MSLPQVTVYEGEGRYKIELTAVITADGISMTLTGGEKPHIGGVVMCLPYAGEKSCDKWITPLPGHKDIIAADLVAEKIAQVTKEKTVVVSGIHINDARAEEIQILLNNCRQAADNMASELINRKRGI